jgi:predicted phosphodiesterase
MSIGIISDIHGNYEALKVVLAELDRMRVSEIVCLGDVVGYYAQVNECCDELRARAIPCVMGNHDWYMASGGVCPRSKSVNDCLVYLRKIITAENVEWLQTFPVQRQFDELNVVHGGWSDPIDEYLKWTPRYFADIPAAASHRTYPHPGRSLDGGKVYCNPGSVGQPRDTRSTGRIRHLRRRVHAASRRIRPLPVFALMKAVQFQRLLLRRPEDRCA